MKSSLKSLLCSLIVLSSQIVQPALEACGKDQHGQYEFDIDALGRQIVAWREISSQSILISIGTPGEELADPTTLSADGQFCNETQFATNANGDIVAIWLATTADKPTYSVYANILPYGSANWSGSIQVSNANEGVLSLTSDLVVTDEGNIIVFWESVTYDNSVPGITTYVQNIMANYGTVSSAAFSGELFIAQLRSSGD